MNYRGKKGLKRNELEQQQKKRNIDKYWMPELKIKIQPWTDQMQKENGTH